MGSHAPEPPATSFRAATYNVYGGTDFYEQRLPYIAEEIARGRPDVVCLQEGTGAVAAALGRLRSAAPSGAGYAPGGPGYEVAWTKRQALEQSFPRAVSDSGGGNAEVGALNAAAAEFGWDGADALAELSELMILVNRARFQVEERELVWRGNWFDDGIIRVRLRGTGHACPLLIDVYNVHFCGGSFGKPPEELARKRACRVAEFRTLKAAVAGRAREPGGCDGPDAVVIAGDFNCDVDDPATFPEANESIELEEADGWRCWRWIDAGKGLGATESTSRNAFRAALKPGQSREVRFDRILVGSFSPGSGREAEAEGGRLDLTCDECSLLGTAGCGEALRGGGASALPLLPSDHFGVAARILVTRRHAGHPATSAAPPGSS